MIRPMMNHTLEMIAVQYEEYVRTQARQRPPDDEPMPSRRRRTARRPRRVADSVDPGNL